MYKKAINAELMCKLTEQQASLKSKTLSRVKAKKKEKELPKGNKGKD